MSFLTTADEKYEVCPLHFQDVWKGVYTSQWDAMLEKKGHLQMNKTHSNSDMTTSYAINQHTGKYSKSGKLWTDKL